MIFKNGCAKINIGVYKVKGGSKLEKKKLDRISELYRLSKQRSLTEEELKEQKDLRDEYRQGYVRNLTQQLEHTEILRPDGTKVRVSDLKRKAENRR